MGILEKIKFLNLSIITDCSIFTDDVAAAPNEEDVCWEFDEAAIKWFFAAISAAISAYFSAYSTEV